MEIIITKISKSLPELEKIKARIRKVTPHALAEAGKEHIEENYHKSRNFDGSPMARLKAGTIAIKRRLSAANPALPLVLTGQLRQAHSIIDLNENASLLMVNDKSRGGITNTGILNINKKLGRTPFGLGEPMIQYIRKRIKNLTGFKSVG